MFNFEQFGIRQRAQTVRATLTRRREGRNRKCDCQCDTNFVAIHMESMISPQYSTNLPKCLNYVLDHAIRRIKSNDRETRSSFGSYLHQGSTHTTIYQNGRDNSRHICIEPVQRRILTERPIARLRTFQNHIFFARKRVQQYRQVWNAVPSMLGDQIGYVVAEQLTTRPFASQGIYPWSFENEDFFCAT